MIIIVVAPESQQDQLVLRTQAGFPFSFLFNLVIFSSHLPPVLSSLGLSCHQSTGLPAFFFLGRLSLLPSESLLEADDHWACCLCLALSVSQ